ncbi:hypothetical protein V8E55_004886, partial [Tylopilus felleus]
MGVQESAICHDRVKQFITLNVAPRLGWACVPDRFSEGSRLRPFPAPPRSFAFLARVRMCSHCQIASGACDIVTRVPPWGTRWHCLVLLFSVATFASMSVFYKVRVRTSCTIQFLKAGGVQNLVRLPCFSVTLCNVLIVAKRSPDSNRL